MADTAWICVTTIAVVAIIALALSFKNNQSSESAVTYEYDDQNRLKSISPTLPSMVSLRPI